MYLNTNFKGYEDFDDDDDDVDGMRLCLRTAATNEPIVHPEVIYEHGEPWWNDIDKGNS
jgi:hypothetical protein